MRDLAAFRAIVVLRAQFFRLSVPDARIPVGTITQGDSIPSKARGQRIISIPTLPLQFKANIQNGIGGGVDMSTSITDKVALQLTGKGCMHNTVTGNVRMATGVAVDVVQCGYEEFMSILLSVPREVDRLSPGGCEKGDGSIGSIVTGVHL